MSNPEFTKESEKIFQEEILTYLKSIIALGEEPEFLAKVKSLFPSDLDRINVFNKLGRQQQQIHQARALEALQLIQRKK